MRHVIRVATSYLWPLSTICLLCGILFIATPGASAKQLKRVVTAKPIYKSLPKGVYVDHLILKLKEGAGQPKLSGSVFDLKGGDWDQLNGLLSSSDKSLEIRSHFTLPKTELDEMRARGSQKIGEQLPDLTLYYRVPIDPEATSEDRIQLANQLNQLDIVELAYFEPKPELASVEGAKLTPMWEEEQYYLQPAPTGIDAYYAWSYGTKGAGVKVIDIEGNWIQTHEDLHGGTDDFHIAGTRINEADWWNHGTAVLGEIAADSNDIGMTGIAFNVDLGTVSIGSLSTANALTIATNNSDSGDVILIELHAPGPNSTGIGQEGYVPMEYWQDNFDAILYASSLGRIVVEAGGNGAEDLDAAVYASVFDPDFRWSGAVMVGASDDNHWPASFTNYGERIDVHAFGTWDVYTLGYGDLYGSGPDNNYTGTFAGTSSASPIITGACALLQEIHKTTHGRILWEDEMHDLLRTYSTPQQPHPKQIGPLPDLRGSTDQILGVSFVADTTIGWIPLDVNFAASSGLAVDTWLWDFGDGGSSQIQSPAHEYTSRGLFNVSVQVDADGDIRTATRQQYIAVIADSMWADTVEISGPGDIEIIIYGSNTIPLEEIRIPVEFSGAIDLVYDSFSTAGCRTDYFELKEQMNWTPSKQTTFRLLSSVTIIQPDLPSGNGPVLKVYFHPNGAPAIGQTTPIVVSGYHTSYMPEFNGDLLSYQPWTFDGAVSYPDCCVGIRGNINDDAMQVIDISDLVYMVDYMFSGGPVPTCLKEVNVNGDIFEQIGIDDLVYLVDYMFSSGPDPIECF